MARYQEMCENLNIHLEVVWTSNSKTLVFVDLDQQDHDCIKGMDEVFSYQLNLTLKNPGCWVFDKW